MKAIELPNGKRTLLDEDDHERFSQFNWCLSNGYPSSRMGHRGPLHYLHKLIMDCPGDLRVDHINGDPLDNRRSNLRICTHQENIQSQRIHKNNTSGFKGVSLDKASGRWRAYIKIDYRHKWLGYFDTAEQAARAYDEAAREMFGEFAILNAT